MTLFQIFMQLVDAELNRVCGLGHGDWADYMYHDAFDDGETPEDVARQVLIENDFPL